MIVTAETRDEAIAKCEEIAEAESAKLAESLGVKVLYYVFFMGKEGDDFDFAIAYMQEPNRGAKMSAMDLIYGLRATQAADNIWFANKIKEHTDARIDKNDDLYLGLMSSIIEEVKFMGAALKKK